MKVLSFIAIAVSTYYVMAVVHLFLHRSFGHKNRIRPVYKAHALGHHAKYKNAAMQGDAYIDSEHHVLFYFLIPIGVSAMITFAAGGLFAMSANLVGIAFTFWWHLHLHEHYHLSSSPYDRFRWFRKKRQLHFVHHRNDRYNYAIVEFWIDGLFGSRRDA